jgi:transposase-like protein
MDAQRRGELLARFEAGGLTQKAFAKREGVNFHTFVSWLSQRRREAGGGGSTRTPQCTARFIELSAPAHMPGATGVMLEVVLRDGRIARGADAAALAALARLLES